MYSEVGGMLLFIFSFLLGGGAVACLIAGIVYGPRYMARPMFLVFIGGFFSLMLFAVAKRTEREHRDLNLVVNEILYQTKNAKKCLEKASEVKKSLTLGENLPKDFPVTLKGKAYFIDEFEKLSSKKCNLLKKDKS